MVKIAYPLQSAMLAERAVQLDVGSPAIEGLSTVTA